MAVRHAATLRIVELVILLGAIEGWGFRDLRRNGALELAGNLGALTDGLVHPTINVTELDPKCAVRNLVIDGPREVGPVEYILNNSFGMLGINSAVVVKRYVR